jgi:hypothetical protein
MEAFGDVVSSQAFCGTQLVILVAPELQGVHKLLYYPVILFGPSSHLDTFMELQLFFDVVLHKMGRISQSFEAKVDFVSKNMMNIEEECCGERKCKV